MKTMGILLDHLPILTMFIPTIAGVANKLRRKKNIMVYKFIACLKGVTVLCHKLDIAT